MVLIAVIYSVAIVGASLVGGALPMVVRLTHTRMQVALSFVAGVMLGVGVLHLVPHGFAELVQVDPGAAMDRIVWWLLIGFVVMFFLERFFHFHQHDAPAEVLETDAASPHDVTSHVHCDHDHAHDHAHDHEHGHDHGMHHLRFTWGGAAIGLAPHSLVDGLAMAAAIAADWSEGAGFAAAGLGTFLAIFLHKPFDSLTISTLMAAGGWSASARHLVNLIFALVAPLGVAIFFFGINRLGPDQYHLLLGCALGFAAGAFVCIAASDLLPELQFHSHDRGKLSLALVLGLALAWAIVFVEHSGHTHAGEAVSSSRFRVSG